MGRQNTIDFHEAGVSKQLSRKSSSLGRKLRSRVKYQRLIASGPSERGITYLVVCRRGICSQLRHHYRLAVLKLHHGWHIENVLIVAGEDKCFVALDRAAKRRSKLILLIVRIESHERRSCSPERTAAQIIKLSPVPVFCSRLGYDIHHRTAGPTRLRSVTARRHAELLHRLV